MEVLFLGMSGSICRLCHVVFAGEVEGELGLHMNHRLSNDIREICPHSQTIFVLWVGLEDSGQVWGK
eukprot:4617572-Ditylum_brightwellii.AAC.1